MNTNQKRPGRTAAAVIIVTCIIEAICIFFRFGLGWVATRDTRAVVAPLTGNIRIHHGYFGAVLMVVAWFLFTSRPNAARWMGILGAGLLLSDLIHHLLILWPITGNPELDFFYSN